MQQSQFMRASPARASAWRSSASWAMRGSAPRWVTDRTSTSGGSAAYERGNAAVARGRELGRRMTGAGAVQRIGSVVLQVAGTEQHARHRNHRGGAPRDQVVDGGVQVGLRELDEAAAHVEVRGP